MVPLYAARMEDLDPSISWRSSFAPRDITRTNGHIFTALTVWPTSNAYCGRCLTKTHILFGSKLLLGDDGEW
jgi:hypothetical protein